MIAGNWTVTQDGQNHVATIQIPKGQRVIGITASLVGSNSSGGAYAGYAFSEASSFSLQAPAGTLIPSNYFIFLFGFETENRTVFIPLPGLELEFIYLQGYGLAGTGSGSVSIFYSIQTVAADVFFSRKPAHVGLKTAQIPSLPLPEDEPFSVLLGRVESRKQVLTTNQAYEAATDALQYLFLFVTELALNQVLFITKADLLTLDTSISGDRFATILDAWFYNGAEGIVQYLLLPQLGFASSNIERFRISGVQYFVEAILARTLQQGNRRFRFLAQAKGDPLAPVRTIRKRLPIR